MAAHPTIAEITAQWDADQTIARDLLMTCTGGAETFPGEVVVEVYFENAWRRHARGTAVSLVAATMASGAIGGRPVRAQLEGKTIVTMT